MARYQEIGRNFKSVTCAQTGETVTRRKSLAVDYRGDGTGGSPAAPCQRVKRELAPKPTVLTSAPNSKYLEDIRNKMTNKIKAKVAPKAVKALSTKEKAQMKKLIQKKRDEDKKPA